MAVSKEILDLIPQGCKVNWNEKQQRFYVYKSTYYYSKETQKDLVNSVPRSVRSLTAYLLMPKATCLNSKIKDLKQEVKSSTADVVNKTSEILSNEVIDPRQAAKVQYPLAYVYFGCSAQLVVRADKLCSKSLIIGATHRAALETVF